MPIGLSLKLSSGGGVGSTYSAEATAYFASVPNSTYSDAEKIAIDTFLTGLKTGGIWDKIDQLFLLCAKSSTSAESLVNLRYPTYAANAVPSADPRRAMSIITNGGAELTWQSGIGWSTTSGADKLSGNYVPDGNYQCKSTSGHVMVHTKSNVSASNTSYIFADSAYGAKTSLILRTLTDDTVGIRLGGSTQRTATGNVATAGSYIATMVDTTKLRLYKNGTAIVSNDAHTFNTLPSSALGLFYYYDHTGGFFSGTITAHSIGGALTEVQAQAYHTLIDGLLTTLGAK